MPTKGRRRGARRAAPRRRPVRVGRFIGFAVIGLLVAVLLTDFGSGGGGGADDADGGAAGRDGGSATTGDDGGGRRPGAAATTAPSLPADVEEPLAPIDIAAVPDGAEPASVASWWAATYTAYIGAETPAQLATRLAPLTTAALKAELEALPPAASYDDGPVAIEGASSSSTAIPAGSEGQPQEFRITVETSGPIVIYVLGLVDEGGGAGWRVTEARRL